MGRARARASGALLLAKSTPLPSIYPWQVDPSKTSLISLRGSQLVLPQRTTPLRWTG